MALIFIIAFIPVVAADCILLDLHLKSARQAELDSFVEIATSAAIHATVINHALHESLLHLASLALALAIGLTGSNTVLRPLKKLRNMALDITHGNSNVHPRSSSKDEMAATTEAFNQMADRVAHAEESLLMALQTHEEERRLLESVLMQIPSGVVVAQASTGQPFIINQQLSDILGYSFTKLTSLDCLDNILFHRPDGTLAPRLQRPLWRAMNNDEIVRDEELHGRCANGATVILQMSAAPIYDADHHIIAGVALINDITEKRAMEKALQLAEEERASTQNRFLQLMAHELRNPMAGLSGLIDLLGRRLDKGRPTSELHHLMKREINRLSIMLNQILDAFRAQNDRLPLLKQCIDIGPIVTSALEPFVATEPEGRITWTSPSAPTWVFGDPGRLEDVVRNLVGNALKYSPPDSGIEITLRDEAESALLSIKDQGVGIPEADQPLIFDGFYRASNVATNGPGGVGLGLYLCKDIIDRHDGRIWVESKHGCGSTFFVQLPIYNHLD